MEILWLIIIIPLLLLPAFLYTVFMKRKIEKIAPSLRRLLNQPGWKTHIQKYGRYGSGSDIYISGYWQGRLINCTYAISGLGMRVIGIDCTPNTSKTTKKTPWYKYVSEYPTVYTNNKQNYIFNNEMVYTLVRPREYDNMLSEQTCRQIFDDVVHACEIVERGE